MEYRSVSVVAPPRPTKRPPDAEALDALIEEARRRTRRRRRRFGACVLLVGMAGAVAFVGLRGESGPVPPAAEPMPRLEPVVGPPALKNGPLTIAAVEANGRHEGPSGWYGLSTVRRDGRLETLVRCPNRVRWCGEVESIDWSPDGRRLALSVSSVGVANPYNGIHVVDLTTGADRQIRGCNDPPGECDWFDLDWSPDGSKLAYVSHGNIVLIDSAGGGRQILQTRTVGRDASPSWSSDGRLIAFANKTRDGWSVYRVDINGTNRRLLAEYASTPAWSPLGTAIAYRSRCGIKLMTRSGADVTPLRNMRCNAIGLPGLGWPVWSPDGRKIAAMGTSRYGTGARAGGTWVMNADGSRLTRITTETFSVWMGQQPRASWRPIR